MFGSKMTVSLGHSRMQVSDLHSVVPSKFWNDEHNVLASLAKAHFPLAQ